MSSPPVSNCAARLELDQQRQTGKLVEGKEAGVRRLCLHGKRRFQLEQVLLGVGHAIEVQGQLGERDRIRDGVVVDALAELRAQGGVQLAEDEVVRRGRADLLGGLTEIAVAASRQRPVEVGQEGRRPHGRRLGRQQLRRPAAEVHRAAAEAVGQAGKTARHVGAPRHAPDLGAGNAGVDRDRPGYVQAEYGQVLDVFGEHKPARFEHQRAARPRLVDVQKVLRKDRSEGAAADNDHVERTRVGVETWIAAGEGLIEAVADVASEHVAGEIGVLRSGTGGHCSTSNDGDEWRKGFGFPATRAPAAGRRQPDHDFATGGRDRWLDRGSTHNFEFLLLTANAASDS